MQVYFGARILMRRTPSWIKTRKRRKGVLGSRGESKKGVTGEGETKMVADLLHHKLIPITHGKRLQTCDRRVLNDNENIFVHSP